MWNKCSKFFQPNKQTRWKKTICFGTSQSNILTEKRFPKTICARLDGKLSKNKQKQPARPATTHISQNTNMFEFFVFVCFFHISHFSSHAQQISHSLFCLIMPPPEHPTSCSLICLVAINCWRIYWVARRLKRRVNIFYFLFFIVRPKWEALIS